MRLACGTTSAADTIMPSSNTRKSSPILVAHDLTESGDEALRQADAWARRRDLPLVVCHAIPDPLRIAPLFPHENDKAMDAMGVLQHRAGEAVVERSARLVARDESEIEVAVAPGAPQAVITDQAARLEAALIVVGTTHNQGVGRFLLGSTAEQVVRHAETSVLIARPSDVTNTIMVATDLSEHAMTAVQAAVEEAKHRKAKLIIVHSLELAHPVFTAFEPSLIVDEVTKKAMRDAAERTCLAQLERGGAEGSAKILEGRAATKIVQAAEDLRADLVVVGTHGHTGIKRFALGSVAAEVARRVPSSVLVVRA